MKTIIFIGCSRFGTSKEALTVAKEMGYYIVLFTDKVSHLSMKLDFLDVDQIIFTRDLFDKKKVIGQIEILKAEGKQICSCISFIDPFVSYTVKLSEQLGILKSSADSLFMMENKLRFREELKHLPSSPFYAVFHHDTAVGPFIEKYKSFLPLIIKPPASNGSKDVLLVDTKEKFGDGIKFLQKRYPKLPILVEEFLLGPQYLLETIVYNNEITVVAVIEQEIISKNRFIVTGYKYPALLTEDEYSNLYASVTSIVKQLGLVNGSCHLEMREVQGEWKLVEINPRMSGGAMNRIIEEGTGINLIKEIIKLYLGEQPSLIASRKQHVYAQYVTIGSSGKLLKVIGEEQAIKHNGVKHVSIIPLEGSIVTEPYSMGNRYACVIATSESPNQAKEIALAAAKEIKFYIEPL